MCPVCLTTALLIAGSVASTSGLAAIAIKTFGVKKVVGNHSASKQSRLSRTKNSVGEVFPNADERRNQDVN
jgi:hypothetical protein